MHIVRIAGYDRERSPLVTRTGASRSSSETALPIRPLISLRLDPRLNSRPPVSNMTSNPVTGRALTTVTPTVERGYRHAEQLRNLEQRHEPFAALERAGQAFWRRVTPTVAVRSLLDASGMNTSLSLCSIEPALVTGKR
jgi:hypothetical protein